MSYFNQHQLFVDTIPLKRMEKESNSLDDLYIGDDSYDKQRLVNVLNDYIGIDPNDASIVSKPALEELDDAQKTVCYLLLHLKRSFLCVPRLFFLRLGSNPLNGDCLLRHQ